MNWLAEVNQVEWELKGLKSTMAALGHGYVDVLKVDVDGSEWSLIDELLSDRSLDVEQLVIELHFDPLESKANREVKEQKLKGLEVRTTTIFMCTPRFDSVVPSFTPARPATSPRQALGFVPVSIIKPNDNELEVSYVNSGKGRTSQGDGEL